MSSLESIQAALVEALRKHQAGRIDEAVRTYTAILRAFPANPDALHLRGLALHQRGDHPGATISIRRSLAIDASQAAFHMNLGQALAAQLHLAESATATRRAICLAPADPKAYYNLGLAFEALGDMRGAAHRLQRSLHIHGMLLPALASLAAILQNIGIRDAAVTYARRAIAGAPDATAAYNCLAVSLKDLGLAAESIQTFRRALAQVWSPMVHRNMVLTLHYLDDLDPRRLAHEHRRWAAGVGTVERCHPKNIDRTPDRRLSVGYLSGDLRTHVVGRNLIGLTESHDKRRVDVTMYSNVPRPDSMTARFRAVADRWRDIHRLPDVEVARQIAADRIDILVCCAGHVGENRIEVAALGPAPIQASLHDVTSSGLPTVDYWLTDGVLHPPAVTTEPFTEALFRLPCFYLHQPIEAAPDPGPVPESLTGRITFGSCNNPAKLSPRTLSTWAAILRAVPGSRLALWHFDAFGVASLRARLVDTLGRLGIERERLLLEGSSRGTKTQHLEFLRQIDIALDPLPFNGATTTFEQLWMGVPVVTVAGDRFTSRVGASMLRPLGLDHLVAETPEVSVGIAAALAADRGQREMLRAGLRSRLRASVLCDTAAYTRSVENAYATMWKTYVAG
jgi:protein O-GlcNAc transferase